MNITNIVQKRKGLSAIYIDGEFALNLDTETIIISKFSIGSEISDQQLKELIDKSNEKRSKEKALWLISYRDHSKKELKTKLLKTVDENSALKTVERMEELGLINDEKYARRYVNELINTKHLSKKGALYKLIEKGIDRELADIVLDELDIDPRQHIRALIQKKYVRTICDEKGKKRAVSALQRLGYNWCDINAVLNEFLEEDYI